MFIQLIHVPGDCFSPWVERVVTLHVYRDDATCLGAGTDGLRVRGNKARKLHTLWTQRDWVEAYRGGGIVSHGGAQSNAMLALAVMAGALQVPFEYIAAGAPRWLRASPNGNYRRAVQLGVRFRHVSRGVAYREAVQGARRDGDARRRLYIPQGCASPLAASGLQQLALALENAASDRYQAVCVPAGTGTTAFYLRQYLSDRWQVLTVPCVGDAAHLDEQMRSLAQAHRSSETQPARWPTVLPPPEPRLPFAALDERDWRLWQCLPPFFDLVYAPRTLRALVHHFQADAAALARVLYVATGGTEGNETQRRRYMRRGYPMGWKTDVAPEGIPAC
ncbi:hypothetical protein CDCA_CDCA11G3213 [Cyanidium caldarium]|uniref:1-aminocyclopropane-1-carboxylate deaminase n=1 Tax=Cyanidium caldarium TaxID=2771 RepID=A0AAV9IYJ7_CYACA|nr:hypothetical protein CDCA_CDCA11G3213 [Cyanidium caldarium]